MFKIRFISAHLWLSFILCTVFIKIYQYNLYIKTTYEYQRLGRRFADLEKERNELLVCRYEQQQPIKLMQEAERLGMQPLQLDAILTATQVTFVDFVGTTSTAQVLERCGIPSIVITKPEIHRVKEHEKGGRTVKILAAVTEREGEFNNDLSAIAARLSAVADSLPSLAFATTDDGYLGNFIIEKV